MHRCRPEHFQFLFRRSNFGSLILCIDAAQSIFNFFFDEATLVRFGSGAFLLLVAIGVAKKVPQSRFVALVHVSVIFVIMLVALGACLATRQYPHVFVIIEFLALGFAIFILTRPSVLALFPSLSGKTKVKICFCYVILIAAAMWHQQNVEIGKVLSKNDKVLEHIERGNQYLDEREYDLATKEFEGALKIDPDHFAAKSNLRLARERSSTSLTK